ncbi:nucleoside 2-deoxyribosyltransferase [Aeromonas aquatilis]
MSKKIYLAGPEVFLNNVHEVAAQKKELYRLYGFIGLFPLDNKLELNEFSPADNGLKIAKANEDLIAEADLVIANMTPFRGASCDVGTAALFPKSASKS